MWIFQPLCLFENAAYTENGTIPMELTEMIEGITLNIYADSISLDMSGNKECCQ